MHGPREQPARAPTIPQGELLPRHGHAALTICGFIGVRLWSMIDIIPSGKRKELPSGGNDEDDHAQTGHSAATKCRGRTIRPAGARYVRHEFLPRRSGAGGPLAHPSAG
ncbi:protein of unknown function [Bradyrhizobium vignae]|uniref:Uncharacterized protein n=1 Tax=Bradyrhizobium vignae TaxID=1549949 RepID=A0A2U3QBX3_9BRAD|nr:protein of unknown function [Bradyrhizobium vignae]